MSRRGWRTVFDRHLVEGLTVDERIARLEGRTDTLWQRAVAAETELLRRQMNRRRRLSFLRWFLNGLR